MNAAAVIELGRAAEGLIIDLDPAPGPPLPPEAERCWQQRRAANPRLFDGPIVCLDALEQDRAGVRVRAHVDRYRSHVAGTGELVGVSGLVIAPIGRRRCVLVARRSMKTHHYPGLWELAPSGGVPAPAPGRRVVTIDDLRAQLEREWAEELAGGGPIGRAEPVLLCRDPNVPSTDVVFRVELEAVRHAGPGNWEYDAVAWAPVEELLDAASPRRLIPPTRAVLRWLIGEG